MAEEVVTAQEPVSRISTNNSGTSTQSTSRWRRFFGRESDNVGPEPEPLNVNDDVNGPPLGQEDEDEENEEEEEKERNTQGGLMCRASRRVVAGLPRAPTFKRQQSELRANLEAVQPTPAERRAVSMNRKRQTSGSTSQAQADPRASALDFLPPSSLDTTTVPSDRTAPFPIPSSPSADDPPQRVSSTDKAAAQELASPSTLAPEKAGLHDALHGPDAASFNDSQSVTTSVYDRWIQDELDTVWILNLSMHFRDRSRREKFFVTYRERALWRRVTISVDYRDAPDKSLESELTKIESQREKSAKIYEAIRESLADIQFYDTVTNLKLQTTDGRLHVHVVEDVNEIILYPQVRLNQHLTCCRRVKESQIVFDSHMSGYVYKVRVNAQVLVKKEIPGRDAVDEFMYEINALSRLRPAMNVIHFYGIVVDDHEENITGLLISYAEQGALIDILYEHDHSLPWSTRQKWAYQIVNGLSEIHEAGFVQGDFTLSNIVIDEHHNAKIIDINRRGCPVGWEPPEATALIESSSRISLYIGVKSDLYQLGMVLWALAVQEDEPDKFDRPLRIGPSLQIPSWYLRIVEICLSQDPRGRLQALHLLSLFPTPRPESHKDQKPPAPHHHDLPPICVDKGSAHDDFSDAMDGSAPIKTAQRRPSSSSTQSCPDELRKKQHYSRPQRGRSPPRDGVHRESTGYTFHDLVVAPPSETYTEDMTAPSLSAVSHSDERYEQDEKHRQVGNSVRSDVCSELDRDISVENRAFDGVSDKAVGHNGLGETAGEEKVEGPPDAHRLIEGSHGANDRMEVCISKDGKDLLSTRNIMNPTLTESVAPESHKATKSFSNWEGAAPLGRHYITRHQDMPITEPTLPEQPRASLATYANGLPVLPPPQPIPEDTTRGAEQLSKVIAQPPGFETMAEQTATGTTRDEAARKALASASHPPIETVGRASPPEEATIPQAMSNPFFTGIGAVYELGVNADQQTLVIDEDIALGAEKASAIRVQVPSRRKVIGWQH